MSIEYAAARTITEKKAIVLKDIEELRGPRSHVVDMVNTCWKVLDRSTDFKLFLDFYWSDLRQSSDNQEVLFERVAAFVSSLPVKDVKRYMTDLLQSSATALRNGQNALNVREFTEGARGSQPDRPSEPLTRKQVEFVVSMVTSEMVELSQTVLDEDENPVTFVRNLCSTDYNREYTKPVDNGVAVIAEQADAMVDAMYYMYDTTTRMGVNLDSVFNVVHAANMAKRGSNGQFIIRPTDNKICKPEGWKEPDIRGEIAGQITKGAWY